MPNNRINYRHYFANIARDGGVVFAATFASAFLAGSIVHNIQDEDPSIEGSSPGALESFNDQLGDLLIQRTELDYLKALQVKETQNSGEINLKQEKYELEAKTFLTDLMIDSDGSSLSEKDKVDLLSEFNEQISDLSDFEFTLLSENAAGFINNTDLNTANYSDNSFEEKFQAAKQINTSAIEESNNNWQWVLFAFLLTSFMFPSARDVKNNEKLEKWSKEPPTVPRINH